MVSSGIFAERTCVISFDRCKIICFSCLLMSFPAASTRSLGINLEMSADDVYSYDFPNKVCGFVEWMHKGALTVSGVFAHFVLFFVHREYVIYLDRRTKVYSLCLMLWPTESKGSCWMDAKSWSPHFSLTESRWSRWIDTEWCGNGIPPFFAHRKYVISLDQCRIVWWWDLPVSDPQFVCDLVGSIENSVLMGSPCFSPTGSTWFRGIDADSCANGISAFLTLRLYVIWLDVESWAHGISPFLSDRK